MGLGLGLQLGFRVRVTLTLPPSSPPMSCRSRYVAARVGSGLVRVRARG